MSENHNHREKLWKDYLNLCEKYSSYMNPGEFAYHMISNTAQMAVQCAKNKSEVLPYLEEVLKEHVEFYLKQEEE